MEPGIRTRLTNLLAMVAAPEKYDKNVKLKFPFEFYLKKVLEYVKKIKVTAPAIIEALENSDLNDITQIQEILETQAGIAIVAIDPLLLQAIGTYATECTNTIIESQQDSTYQVIGGSQYEDSVTFLYDKCIEAFTHTAVPYIDGGSEPFTRIPVNQCYNNELCASFDVAVQTPNLGSYIIHFSMFINSTTIILCATKLTVISD